MPRNRRTLLFATTGALLVVATAAVCWRAVGFVRPSVGYALCAEFTTLPSDDAALEQWLRDQPDVVGHTVRVERSGATLSLFWIMSQDFLGDGRLPHVDAKCAELGYAGQVAPFRDCPR